jgi:hypothetical protein
MSDVPCFVGIDVAKAQRDIALRPSGERWAVSNDASGVTTLVDQLQAGIYSALSSSFRTVKASQLPHVP